MSKSNKQRRFVRTLLAWYTRRGRTLPWRGIADPYRILISEVMLQQTQVGRVLQKYPLFLRRFPTLHSLARASQSDVVRAWQGMGYNNRAVRLHKFARQVRGEFGGEIPGTLEGLIRLPGIGRYTANAILSAAFGKRVPIVDVNVQRVLSRIFWRMESTAALRASNDVWHLAGGLLPARRSYDWNQALMDLGATVCTARKPDCAECPVAALCASGKRMRSPVPVRSRRSGRPATPDRIYRGKAIELLRRRSMQAGRLREAIQGESLRRHEQWFRNLLAGLQKDGLVTVSGNGSFAARRVALA